MTVLQTSEKELQAAGLGFHVDGAVTTDLRANKRRALLLQQAKKRTAITIAVSSTHPKTHLSIWDGLVELGRTCGSVRIGSDIEVIHV